MDFNIFEFFSKNEYFRVNWFYGYLGGGGTTNFYLSIVFWGCIVNCLLGYFCKVTVQNGIILWGSAQMSSFFCGWGGGGRGEESLNCLIFSVDAIIEAIT